MRNLLPIFLTLTLCTIANAKSWRGIVPLHSTREDVERLLGKPNGRYGRYEFDNEWVEIHYSTGRCVNGWNVPTGTVINIAVSPTHVGRLSDLKIDLTKYERFRDPEVTSHVYYVNRDDGVRYIVYEDVDGTSGKILTIYYESTTQDVRTLYCGDPNKPPNYFDTPADIKARPNKSLNRSGGSVSRIKHDPAKVLVTAPPG